MPKFDISSLEGWLTKKRGPGKQKVMGILSGDTKRWFQVKELNSANQAEITLCYFKSQHEKEARGWIYMKDVTDLYDDGKTITIVSVARSITVEAKSRAEHKFWLEGIANLCPTADKSGLQTEIKCFAENKVDSQNSSRRGSFDVKDTNSGKNKMKRENEKLIAESKSSKPNSARSSRSGRDTDDIDDRFGDRHTSDRDSSSRDSNFNKERDRERVSLCREGRGRERDRERDFSSREGRDRIENLVNSNNSRERDRESKSSGHRDKDSREDHRVSSADNLLNGRVGIGEGATTRLHSHIRKDVPLSPNSSSTKASRNNINNQPQENNLREKDSTPAPRQYSFPPQYVYDHAPDDGIETLEISVESLPSSDRDHGNFKEVTPPVGRDGRIEKSKETEIDQKQSKVSNRTFDNEIQDFSNRNSNDFNLNFPEKKSLLKKNEKSKLQYDEEISSEEEEGATVDLQIEKERRNSKNIDSNEKDSGPGSQYTTSEGTGPGHVVRGRPPLPPNGSKPNPYTAIGKIQPSSSYSAHANQNQVSRDANLNDDWDDDSDGEDNKDVHSSVNINRTIQPKVSGQEGVNSGVRADTNWLDDDFDDA